MTERPPGRLLHLVVHHRNDPHQPWVNAWAVGSDAVLETITTTKEIGRLCEAAKRAGAPVRIHRCAYSSSPALVCSEAHVAAVQSLDRSSCLVRFERSRTIDLPPPKAIPQGTRWY